MKKFIVATFVISMSFAACDTPAPAAYIPSDSIMDSGKPAPDSIRTDSSRRD